MYVSTSEIVQKANSIVAQCGTRDPIRIARDLGIEVMYYPFNEQRGAYKVLMRNRFIFVKNDLHPAMANIVLLHELGHDALHRFHYQMMTFLNLQKEDMTRSRSHGHCIQILTLSL